MKEQMEGVGATAFDYPNSINPYGKHPVYYGDQNVPKQTNAAAKVTHAEKVMSQVLRAK